MTPQNTYHAQKVAALQAEVRRFYDTKTKIRVYHGSTNSTRNVFINRQKMVDISSFDQIIEINSEDRYAIVEANVMLDKLIDATLEHGLLPIVVSEFPGISVGGAIQGGAGESSSFRWGGFHDICSEYEVVTANGDIVVANEQSHPDLFHGIACSYGSIGIITKIKLQLLPVTPNIELEYIRVTSYDEALGLISKTTKTSAEFVDAIMFTPTSGVVMVGNFSINNDLPIATYSRLSDEWFYIHAQKIASKHKTYRESIPIRDYLFRYDRGAFWMGKYGYKLYHIPFNRFTRLWFASLMKTRTMYRYLHGANMSQQFIVQDVCLPQENVRKFLSYLDENIGIYPLWLCPLKSDTKSSLAPNHLKTKLVVNVGVWGEFHRPYDDFVAENRKMEQRINKLGGRKVLYAHTYYSRAEFWKNYDQHNYKKLRNTYQAPIVFPEIYDKVVMNKRLKPSHIKGWMAFIKSPF